MRVIISVSLILFGLSVISLRTNALSGGEEYYATIDANKIIDVVISAAKSRMRFSLEPVSLPDINRTLTVPLGLIDLNGIVKAVNGTLSGLSTLDRLGNASFVVDGVNSSMILELLAQNLNFTYETEIIIMGLISTTAQVVGQVSNVVINSTLLFSQNGILTLKQFFIEEFENIVVEIQGSGIFETLLNLLIELFTSLAKTQIKDELSNIMLTVIGPLFQEVSSSAK